jgi:hypothetical protein
MEQFPGALQSWQDTLFFWGFVGLTGFISYQILKR